MTMPLVLAPTTTGSVHTSSFSNQKPGPYATADAPKPVATLSGHNGDPIGLVDFTGDPRYKQNKNVRMVLAADTKAAFDRTVDAINALPLETKNKIYGEQTVRSWPKDGNGNPVFRPGFTSATRTNSEQVYTFNKRGPLVAAKPGESPHEPGMAGDVDVWDTSCFPNDKSKLLFQQMAYDNGLYQIPERGTTTADDGHGRLLPRTVRKGETQHYQYLRGPTQAQRMEHLTKNGDLAAIEQNDRSRKYNAANSSPGYGNYTGNAALEALESQVDPAGSSYSSAMTKGQVNLTSPQIAQEILTAAYQRQPVKTINVANLPSNVGQFGEVEANLAKNKAGGFKDKRDKNVFSRSGAQNAPLGYVSKIDMPAQIQIVVDNVASGGVKSDALSAYERTQIGYIDCFILKNVRVVHDERSFVFQALNGDAVTFFFGNKPSIYNFSGVLMDTYNQQWFNDFEFFYKNYLRGSASLKNKTRVFMMYKDQVVEGFMLNVQMSGDAETNDIISFSFDFILVQKTEIGQYKNPVDQQIDNSRATEAGATAKENASRATATADTSKEQHSQGLLNAIVGSATMVTGDNWKKSLNALPGFALTSNVLQSLTSPTPARPVHAGTPVGPTSEESKPAQAVRDDLTELVDNPEKNRAVNVIKK